jgi:hypothetical protein
LLLVVAVLTLVVASPALGNPATAEFSPNAVLSASESPHVSRTMKRSLPDRDVPNTASNAHVCPLTQVRLHGLYPVPDAGPITWSTPAVTRKSSVALHEKPDEHQQSWYCPPAALTGKLPQW